MIGERIQSLLVDKGLNITKSYSVPLSLEAVTPLIQNLLIEMDAIRIAKGVKQFYVIHNQSNTGSGYEPLIQHLLPLDEKWINDIIAIQWPTDSIPEVIGNSMTTLIALIEAYLFISVFRACTESLAAENRSRLVAMQRAEKNIDDRRET